MSEANHSEEVLLLRQKKAKLAKLLELRDKNGIAFYRPHAGQEAFHAAAGKRYRMVRCGNRWGKSSCGCAEDIAWCLGHRPWYAEGDPRRTLGIPQRPVKGLVITTDWDKVNEIWTQQGGRGKSRGKIWQLAPEGSIVHTVRNHSGAIETIFWKNGSILKFDTVESYKKNPMGSESSDWDFVHVDEPCPRGMFIAAARGLMDRGGSAWFTLTPLNEFWINDLFFPRKGTEALFPPDKIWARQGDTRENSYLSAESIAEFERFLTPEERECRLKGIPMELSGLVYKGFNYDRHVLQAVPAGWEDFDRPPKDYIIYTSIDTHPQTPHAVLFVAVNQLGQRFIYDELFVSTDPEQFAALVLSKQAGYYSTPTKCEPAAWISDPITGTCLAEEFAKHGLYVEEASKAKTFGIMKMQAEWRKNNVFVSPNCTRFLFEINRYCYNKENKPIDKDDHLMECMYRLFINDPIWFDPDTANYEVSYQPIGQQDLSVKNFNPFEL